MLRTVVGRGGYEHSQCIWKCIDYLTLAGNYIFAINTFFLSDLEETNIQEFCCEDL